MKEVDACLTTFLDIPILQTNSPNKFFEGLAAAKMCIVNTRGWLKELVEEHKCGIFVDAAHPREFPKMIAPFVEDEALLHTYQQNARKLAVARFAKDDLVGQIGTLIEELMLNKE